MAIFNVRLKDAEALAFDTWAATRGGRSAALRALIRNATPTAPIGADDKSHGVARPIRLMIRLSPGDGRGLHQAAAAPGSHTVGLGGGAGPAAASPAGPPGRDQVN